jgi:hypothetical protein
MINAPSTAPTTSAPARGFSAGQVDIPPAAWRYGPTDGTEGYSSAGWRGQRGELAPEVGKISASV